ncbi:MAG: ubiquinol-cytochrome c reductase iron-sulfur subunit [Acidobacteriota bacterium]
MQMPGPGRDRRRLLNWLLGSSVSALAGSILYPVFRFISPPRMPESTTAQVMAGPTNDPELVEKGFKIVAFGVEPVILIRVAENDYRAFTATCTHLDCIVGYQKEQRRIWCNCHNGVYDLSGQNVGGPPPKPLTVLQVHLVSRGPDQAQNIVISRS